MTSRWNAAGSVFKHFLTFFFLRMRIWFSAKTILILQTTFLHLDLHLCQHILHWYIKWINLQSIYSIQPHDGPVIFKLYNIQIYSYVYIHHNVWGNQSDYLTERKTLPKKTCLHKTFLFAPCNEWTSQTNKLTA